jgi:RNA polymerase sigma-70 factor (ECF subfamily)
MLAAVEEKELIGRLRSGSNREAVFTELIRTYQRMLYYHIRRIVAVHEDADDVLQNTLLKAWRNLDSFRGEASIRTWLYRIATNEALTHLAQKKRRASDGIEAAENALMHSTSQSAPMSGEDIQQRLHAAIKQLPERQRLVFQMRYYDELKYEDIAGILGVTEGALKASYHHAVRKIEQFLTAAQ